MISNTKPPKPRKCRCGCGASFVPSRPLQAVYGPACALRWIESRKAKEAKNKAKAERIKIRARKDELKPIQRFLKSAERICHAYIRARDADQPCISCGTWDALEYHAGHFIPVGRAKSIRYDEANIHKQCDACNVHLNGNATAYEIRLVAKIGRSEVERLKTAPKEKKWTRDELKGVAAIFRVKLKELKGRK